MTERSLTLVEIHFDEASVQLGSRTFGTTSDDQEDVKSGSDVEEDGADASRCPVCTRSGALLLGVFVVALVVVAWRALGSNGLDTVEELDALGD